MNNEMKKVLQLAPIQLRPDDSTIRRTAIRELQQMGLVYLTYPSKLSALMKVPMVVLSCNGEAAVTPTVKGK